MLRWFDKFGELAKKYKVSYKIPFGYESSGIFLSEEYSVWSADVLNSLKTTDTISIPDLKKSISVACEVYKMQLEDVGSSIHTFVSIAFSIFIAIIVAILSVSITEGVASRAFVLNMLIACVVTVAAILVGLFLDRWPKQKKYYIQFLYYSALLSILDTMGNDGVADYKCIATNTGTVSNLSPTKNTTKNNHRKKRKGVLK